MASETNCADVVITAYICHAIVLCVLIVVLGFLLWKLTERITDYRSERRKHEWEVEERRNKAKSDLRDKLLDFQKGLTFPYDKDKYGGFMEKKYMEKESEDYIKEIKDMINKQ